MYNEKINGEVYYVSEINYADIPNETHLWQY